MSRRTEKGYANNMDTLARPTRTLRGAAAVIVIAVVLLLSNSVAEVEAGGDGRREQ